MPAIRSLKTIDSIKVGPASTVLDNGTIVNPEPYHAVDITFDDGITVQVERPLTVVKVRAVYLLARALVLQEIDGLRINQVIP